jgi:hypothetical protein
MCPSNRTSFADWRAKAYALLWDGSDAHGCVDGLFGRTSQKEPTQKRKALMTKRFNAIAVVYQRSSVAMLEVHRQYPVSNELHKRHHESHKSCKPEYFKLKTIAFPGSLYTYYL